MKMLLNPKYYCILFIIIAVDCKKGSEQLLESSGYLYSTLPVSDTVSVPQPMVSVGIESGHYSIDWYACPEALSYEIERYKDFESWELVYSGGNRSYRIGAIPSGVQYAFRVRAIYKSVVSNWSNSVTVP